MTGSASEQVYLRSYLAPLTGMLARPDVTDIYVNRPSELWVETLGGAIERHDAPGLDARVLERLARQVAALSAQGISREHPLLSATLPDGARVQVAAPPATRGDCALAIRKHVSADLSLSDYTVAGAFAETRLGEDDTRRQKRAAIARRLADGDIAGALGDAVRARLNILVSGGTSTGKTTFLNALLREVPADERLILIEDTPELVVRHANAVGLLAVRGALGEAAVDADDLVTAALRMRPDRIVLGELRGREALAFLRAVNTGHPGSMSTIHADSPAGAVEQLVLLTHLAGTRLSADDVRGLIRSTMDLIIQLSRVGGKREVKGICLTPDGFGHRV